MTTAHVKKVIKIGGSMAIILPSAWARGKVKAGEEMVLVGNSELRMFPLHPNGEKIEGENGEPRK